MSWCLFIWWVAVKTFRAVMFFLSSKLYKPHATQAVVKDTDATAVATDVKGNVQNVNCAFNESKEHAAESQL